MERVRSLLPTELVSPSSGLTITRDSLGVVLLSGTLRASAGSDVNIAVDVATHEGIAVDSSGVTIVPDVDTLDDHREMLDSDEVVKRRVEWLAWRIRRCHHLVISTGAGVSTAAKIPDFRGPNGVWTRRDDHLPPPPSVPLSSAQPTFTHQAIFDLKRRGILKYLVSQNVDGLHIRSGFRADEMSELHGNCFKEICSSCGAQFLRAFDVFQIKGPHFPTERAKDPLSKSGISHVTGRKCDKCGEGMLRDSVIHFSEDLPEEDLSRGIEQCRQADLVIVLGSSLRVRPACNLPEMAVEKKGAVLSIINLQPTPKDVIAVQRGGVLIRMRCDDVMRRLMPLLEGESHLAAKPLERPTTTVLFVGNTSERVDAEHVRWTLFVSDAERAESSPSDVGFASSVSRVEFGLHPTFQPPNVEVSSPPFVLTRIGWGTFHVRVKIWLKGSSASSGPTEVDHELRFDVPSCSTRVEIRP